MVDTSSSPILIAIYATLTLSCTSRGSLPDTFMWRKDNNSTILHYTNMTVEEYNCVFRSDYHIDNVTTSDGGTYICTATNYLGNDSATITVDVISKFSMTTKIYTCRPRHL